MDKSLQKKLQQLTKKKERLNKLRPLPAEQLKNIQEWLDVEYTYTSNAIEGSTLSRSETALVVEKGLTVRGKTLREHLEARNHDKAIDFIRSLAAKEHQSINEDDIKSIHHLILAGIDNQWAGKYRQIEVFIRGSIYEPPKPNIVPSKMKQLLEWLKKQQATHPVKLAAELHGRFVIIHPFIGGNGRTARLLMNLVLIQNGYPIAIIKTNERQAYFEAINKAALTGKMKDFYSVIFKTVERSLDAYLAAGKGKSIIPYFVEKENISKISLGKKLLQIGEVAQLASVPIPTIRYYLDQGLIKSSDKTKGGFMLFEPKVIEVIKKIKQLQKEKRLSIKEISEKLKK